MEATPCKLEGIVAIRFPEHVDERGGFSRLHCAKELLDLDITRPMVQSSLSTNRQKGTLRGLHFQLASHPEGKFVRAIRGRIFDVVVDLRKHSSTFCRWEGFELSRENRRALYIPPGFAHGFQTLEDDCDVLYMMTDCYVPESASGVRWDDPAFGVDWPVPDPIMSPRDAAYPDFEVNDAPF